MWIWDLVYRVSICNICPAGFHSHVPRLPDLVSGSCFLPLAPCMVIRFGWVPVLTPFLGLNFGICPPAASLGLSVSKPPLSERWGKTRTNLALVGSSYDMWVQKFFLISLWAEAKRQRPESEVKVGILQLGVHLRGNAESRSQVVEPIWDERIRVKEWKFLPRSKRDWVRGDGGTGVGLG